MEWHTALLVGKVSKSTPKHLPYASWSCASTHNLILYNIHTSVSRSTFGTLARSQFCWHKFGQFWIRLKHNYIREMSHPSHPFPTAVAAALGSGALSRLSWDPQALLQETPKCCWWHTHTTPHTGSRLASCAELFFLQANENTKTWKVPPNLGAGNAVRVGLRNPCLDHLWGCLFVIAHVKIQCLKPLNLCTSSSSHPLLTKDLDCSYGILNCLLPCFPWCSFHRIHRLSALEVLGSSEKREARSSRCPSPWREPNRNQHGGKLRKSPECTKTRKDFL